MTEALDDQLKRVFDVLAERLQATLADHSSAAVAELLRADVERRLALESATRETAAAQTEREVGARLTQAFAQREREVSRVAREEGFEAGRQAQRADAQAAEEARSVQAQAALDEALKERDAARADAVSARSEAAAARAEAGQARAEVERARSEVQMARAEAQAAHAEADAARAEARTAQDGLASARATADSARAEREAARAEAASARAEADEARSAAQSATASLAVLRADADAAQAVADGAYRAAAARAEHLLRSVAALDRAASLSQALDALVEAVGREADRVVIFLVRGDTLRVWKQAGFPRLDGEPSFELPLRDAGIAADAVITRATERAAADSARRPAFAGAAAAGVLVAVPLAMSGQVIAVTCAEQIGAADEGVALAAVCELLARHAARVLESLTALRLAQLGTHAPVPAAVSPPVAGA